MTGDGATAAARPRRRAAASPPPPRRRLPPAPLLLLAAVPAATATTTTISASSTGFTGAEVYYNTPFTASGTGSFGGFKARFKATPCSGVVFGMSLVHRGATEEHEISLTWQAQEPMFSMQVGKYTVSTGALVSAWTQTGYANQAGYPGDITLEIDWEYGVTKFSACSPDPKNGVACTPAQITDASGNLLTAGTGYVGSSEVLYTQPHTLHVYASALDARPPSTACLPATVDLVSVTTTGAAPADLAQASFASADFGDAANWRPTGYDQKRVSAKTGWATPLPTVGASTLSTVGAYIESNQLRLRVMKVKLTASTVANVPNPELDDTVSNVSSTGLTGWTVEHDEHAAAEAMYDYNAGVTTGQTSGGVGVLSIRVGNTGSTTNSGKSIQVKHKVTLTAGDAYCSLLRARSNYDRTITYDVVEIVGAAETILTELQSTLVASTWYTLERCYSAPSPINGSIYVRLRLGSHNNLRLLHPHVFDIDYAYTQGFGGDITTIPTWPTTSNGGTELLTDPEFALSTVQFPWEIVTVPAEWSSAIVSGELQATPAADYKAWKLKHNSITLLTGKPYNLQVVAQVTGAAATRILTPTIMQIDPNNPTNTSAQFARCFGSPAMMLPTDGTTVTLDMKFDCPKLGLSTQERNAEPLAVEYELWLRATPTTITTSDSVFKTSERLDIQRASLVEWTNTSTLPTPVLPCAGCSPVPKTDADRLSLWWPNLFITSASTITTAGAVPVIAPTSPPTAPSYSQSPVADLSLEEAYLQLYTQKLICFFLANILPQQVQATNLRSALAQMLDNAVPTLTSASANNIKLLTACTVPVTSTSASNQVWYLPAVNSNTSENPVRLWYPNPEDCRGLQDSDTPGEWAGQATSTMLTGRQVEITFMLVNVNPPAPTTLQQVTTQMALAIENVTSTGGLIGPHATVAGSLVNIRDPVEDPRARTVVPTPAPMSRRSSLEDGLWILLLFIICGCCICAGCGTAKIALHYQIERLQKKREREGGRLDDGQSESDADPDPETPHKSEQAGRSGPPSESAGTPGAGERTALAPAGKPGVSKPFGERKGTGPDL